MHYMVIENFRDGDPLPVYRRFRDEGRLAPEIIPVVSSAEAAAALGPRL